MIQTNSYKIRVKYSDATEFNQHLYSRGIAYLKQEIYFMETHLEAIDFYIHAPEDEVLVMNLMFNLTVEKVHVNPYQIPKSELEI